MSNIICFFIFKLLAGDFLRVVTTDGICVFAQANLFPPAADDACSVLCEDTVKLSPYAGCMPLQIQGFRPLKKISIKFLTVKILTKSVESVLKFRENPINFISSVQNLISGYGIVSNCTVNCQGNVFANYLDIEMLRIGHVVGCIKDSVNPIIIDYDSGYIGFGFISTNKYLIPDLSEFYHYEKSCIECMSDLNKCDESSSFLNCSNNSQSSESFHSAVGGDSDEDRCAGDGISYEENQFMNTKNTEVASHSIVKFNSFLNTSVERRDVVVNSENHHFRVGCLSVCGVESLQSSNYRVEKPIAVGSLQQTAPKLRNHLRKNAKKGKIMLYHMQLVL